MMKSESAALQTQTDMEIPKRIAFLLDESLDALHYCAWKDAVQEDCSCGTIRELSTALQQCKIIHPDDIPAFERCLQSKAGLPTVPKADIRLFTSPANYTWYRLYIVAPANQHAQARTISGVLEPLQGIRGSTRHKHEKLHQDTLFRKAVTSSSILSLSFNASTGERLVSDHDVLPPWFPADLRLKDMARILQEQIASPGNLGPVDDLLLSHSIYTDGYNGKPFYRDYQMPDLTKETEDVRWYRVYHSLIQVTRTSPAYVFLNVMDVHEDRMREQLFEENLTYDHTTGMLRQCAFEHRVSQWLKNMKSEASYLFICSVVLVVDHAVDLIAQQGREPVLKAVHTLGKTIQAYIHPHEMCGRYGFARFAMVLSGTGKEILQERLRMLRMICRSLNSEWPDLQVRFGSNMELASQVEQSDVFLEKANQSLQWEENGNKDGGTEFAANAQGLSAGIGNAANLVCHGRKTAETMGKHHIFIRTFGHFDVFVDGEAILFNHTKAKELLALLVDRRGGFVGATEAISCLWEDEPANNTTLSRCRKAALHLRETLLKHGIEYLMETVNGKRRITVANCDCDYYRYLRHESGSSHQIPDSYLNEYSWAENTLGHER